MLGTQFHPEFKSRPNRPHPLFRDFIGACRSQVDSPTGGPIGDLARLATARSAIRQRVLVDAL